MFLDSAYFYKEAENFVNKVGVTYRTVKSGWNKGQYFTALNKPKNIEYFDYPAYMLKMYGDSHIPTDTRYPKADKEKGEIDLIREISSYFHIKHYIKSNQYLSDLYVYYNENREKRKEDIYFDGEIGRECVDYFSLLDKTINQENWIQKYRFKGAAKEVIGAVTTFKELYYSVKEKCKLYWLEKNNYYASYNGKVKLETFIFDEISIPEIAEFEKSLEKPNGNLVLPKYSASEVNNIDKLKSLDLSKLPNTGFVKVGYNKDAFLNKNIVVGRERELVFPNDEVHKSYFAVVELNDIMASHNEVTFGNTANYPVDGEGKNVNDRNYGTDKNAQAKVVTVAQKLNPNIIVSTSATASGTPIISIDGVVVSGNNRTMSMKLAASNYKENFESYKKTLFSELEYGGYGISMAQVYDKFKEPVLVRFDIDFPSYTSTDLNAFNKPRSKSEKNIDKAIRLSKQISTNEGCQNALIQLVSEQDIVSELYNDRNAVSRFKKILIECNIISENEISAFFTDFSLTETGKILYETLLVSIVLFPSAIEISQNPGVKSATNSVVNAIIPLIKGRQNESTYLINEVNNALLIQNDMVNGGYKLLSEFITESTLFDEDKKYKTENSFIINWFLNQKLNEFKNKLNSFNNSVKSNSGESLFGDSLTEQEIFDAVFKSNVDPSVLKALEVFKKHQTPKIKKEVITEQAEIPVQSHREKINSRLQIALKYL